MLLSIVVLSYNRPEQVDRILNNLIGVHSEKCEIVIKDDLSPRADEIKCVVSKYIDLLGINVVFYSNESNMGYDSNLIHSFDIVDSEYVFLLSDDDYVNGNAVASMFDVLERREFEFYFTPYTENGAIKRDLVPCNQISRFSDVVYNSVLFSGLIFSRKSVKKLNLNYDFLKNCIYSQVFISTVLVFNAGCYGVVPNNILVLGGDGDNFFGKNQSAVNVNLLSDRKQVYSNLNYQGFLVEVVDKLSQVTSPNVRHSFIREYYKRLIGYALKARSAGLNSYITFVKAFKSNSKIYNPIIMSVLICISVFPALFARIIYDIGVKSLRKSG